MTSSASHDRILKVLLPGALAVLVVGGLVAAYFLGFLNDGSPTQTSCLVDAAIAPAERKAFETEATKFLTAAFAPQPTVAYPMLTRDAQVSLAADQFGAALQAIVQRSGPHTELKLLHSYFVKAEKDVTSTGVSCGSAAGTDGVVVAARPGATQAHMLFSSRTPKGDRETAIWLVNEGNAWRIQAFFDAQSSLMGRSPNEVLQSARQERDHGHAFNAAMLYSGLQSIVERGPNLQLGVVKALQADYQALKVPAELQGKPPYQWKLGGGEYTVAQVGIVGQDGVLGLTFTLPLSAWNGNEDADKRNRAFLDAFMAAQPDYQAVFPFLVAQALKPDGTPAYRTLHVAGIGYR
jgi:hypothetical protein